jgi:hypothetical protein
MNGMTAEEFGSHEKSFPSMVAKAIGTAGEPDA